MDESEQNNGPKRRVRVEDVARIAGVSPITVSRALSNPEMVREETRQKVREAVEKTGYVLNTTASNLRSGRSSIISMFVSNLHDPHFTQAVQGCADALEGSGFHLMMAQTNYSQKAEADIVASILPTRPAAMVFTGVVQSDAVRATLRASGIPIMEMWDASDDPLDMLVGFCSHTGGYEMGRHFAELGFKNIAYSGRIGASARDTLAGFRESLSAAGKAVSVVEPVEKSPTLKVGRQAFEAIVTRFPECDAIFFGNDVLAIGAHLHAERFADGRFSHVAIAGYGDISIARELSTPLTSIHVSGYEMGLKAGELLLKSLGGEAVEQRTIMCDVSLNARASTLTPSRRRA